ncbi:DUF397 domain-containing protein [Actinomadura geliboluensis]|uniref:DUF397 domain-containing protein n=1 Tax=Actinomadura geliboluensis TaxID=882440 RepID=A0A5S4GIN2_9ACTN|nr:DUF397 domain-containing protein [Actinomadura geliboluensis]TMR26100.1 DUF397 domain-containing protein [Actinomadura geliboluensis]
MSLHDDLSKARWRKASRSSASGSDCVELAHASGVVAVRDSKDPGGPKLLLARTTWQELINRVSRGDFGH